MTSFKRDPDHRCQVFTTSHMFIVDMGADDFLREAVEDADKYGQQIMFQLPVTIGLYSHLHPGKGPDIEGRVMVRWDRVEAVMGLASA